MKKNIIYILICIILIIGIIFGTFVYFKNNGETDTKFSLDEQKWLEQNKNNIVDIYMPSDISIFSYLGKGVFFDYLDSFSTETGLTINPTSYKLGSDIDSNYAFELVSKVENNQIVIYEDNYVIISKDNTIYPSNQDLTGLNIGILKEEEEKVKEKLNNDGIIYTIYETEDELFKSLVPDEGVESTINGIVVLKTLYLDEILDLKLHIVYHIDGLGKKYVLTLNGDKVLNNIIKKYYQKWSKNNLETSYNNHLLSEYFNYNNITEIEKTSLQEKKYVYAFVNNGAYDMVEQKKLTGINYYVIKSFSEFANIDMDYNDEYLSYNDLINDFNTGIVDLFFTNGKYKISTDYYETIKPLDANVVILNNVDKMIHTASLETYKKYTVSVVKNSLIEKYLNSLNIKVKTYNNMDKLLLSNDDIIAIDLDNYEYYKANNLINYKISYQFPLPTNYGYIVNSNDKTFFNLFNFYLEYMPINDIVIESYGNIYHTDKNSNILFILVLIMSLILSLEFISHLKKLINYLKNRAKHSLTKNDKLKYIDPLTSLKNRLYLNDTIEKWDSSMIYPQSIIIVDLNDLTEINDNFGHEEGDKVILEAANILIRSQLPNTEIIRTDGSEFLIYMIEYDEKQTVAYLRKLNKELRDLSHGYGAVTGYSIITDGIKTIDDAINEATLDMKTNKEMLEEE